jgi:cobalt-zinc-cadmium efflux system outer membrane protein
VSRKLLSVLVGSLLLAAAPARAQEVASIDEATFIAAIESDDARVERLAADVQLAEAEIVAARVRPDPEIAIDREEVFPDGGSATNYLRLVWPLDISGRRGHRIAAARASAKAAASDADASRFAIVVDGLRVFYDAAYARLYVDKLRSERDALVRLVEVVEKRVGAGAASGYDQQRIELELAAYDDLVMSAETTLGDARLRLAALVGRSGEELDATSTLELPADPVLPDDSVTDRADYRAARSREDSADARAAEASRGWIPDFGLSLGAMSADVGGETAYGYTIGIAVTVPVFDRGAARRAQANAERRVAKADQRVIEARVPAAVDARHRTLVRRIAQARTLIDTRLSKLDDLLRSAETGYRDGDGSVVELLDAYETARDTRLRDLELRRDARLAELDLWLALGHRP